MADQYKVTAVSKNGNCQAFDFLQGLENTYEASRDGLYILLKRVSEDGLKDMPESLSRLVNAKEKIYEFRKGKLRLFYFKGEDDLLVVCTTAIIKKTQKVDKQEIANAIALKKKYLQSVIDGTLVLIEDNLNETE